MSGVHQNLRMLTAITKEEEENRKIRKQYEVRKEKKVGMKRRLESLSVLCAETSKSRKRSNKTSR